MLTILTWIGYTLAFVVMLFVGGLIQLWGESMKRKITENTDKKIAAYKAELEKEAK